MRHLTKILVTSALLAVALAPAAAGAVNLTFSGVGTSGTDPLGGSWTAGPNFAGFATWTEPLVNNAFRPSTRAGCRTGLAISRPRSPSPTRAATAIR